MPRAWHHSRIWTFTQNYDIAMVCELLISWINIFFYSSDLKKLIPIFKCKLWVLNKQKPIQILKKKNVNWAGSFCKVNQKVIKILYSKIFRISCHHRFWFSAMSFLRFYIFFNNNQIQVEKSFTITFTETARASISIT